MVEMELRSQRKQLIELLKSAGIYDDEMDLEEMRQTAHAMEMSLLSDDAEECMNLDRAILESEVDFHMMFNSTMIIQPVVPTSPIHREHSLDRDCDSPPSYPVHMVVQAEVHHELNWSPPVSPRPLKRASTTSDCNLRWKRSFQMIESNEPNPDVTPISVMSSDSGVTCDEIGSFSSISESSTIPSIGEVPSRLLISTSSAVLSDSADRESIHSREFC